MKTIEACRLCKTWDATRQAAVWDTVLWSEDGLVVTPTLGSLLPGWILVIPEEHALSGAQLDTDRRESVSRALDEIRGLTEKLFGTATVFEHGPATHGSEVGCTVDHVHIHVAPLPFDLSHAAKQTPSGIGLQWGLYERWVDVWDRFSGMDYIATSSAQGIWAASGQVGSQFFRRVIATELGVPEHYDWRFVSGTRHIQDTINAWTGEIVVSPLAFRSLSGIEASPAGASTRR